MFSLRIKLFLLDYLSFLSSSSLGATEEVSLKSMFAVFNAALNDWRDFCREMQNPFEAGIKGKSGSPPLLGRAVAPVIICKEISYNYIIKRQKSNAKKS